MEILKRAFSTFAEANFFTGTFFTGKVQRHGKVRTGKFHIGTKVPFNVGPYIVLRFGMILSFYFDLC